MWNRRVSSRLCVVSALLPVSLLLLGCHHQHSSASNKAMPQGTDSIALVNGLPVQQSEGYQARRASRGTPRSSGTTSTGSSRASRRRGTRRRSGTTPWGGR